jgi:hypothetical protein
MYTPEFGGKVYGYAVNFLSRNEWRVRPYWELDDLLQECYIFFVEWMLRYEYEDEVHFMSVWKMALSQALNDWSSQANRRRCLQLDEDREEALKAKPLVSTWEERVESAPAAVRQLLEVVESKLRRRPRRIRPNGTRLSTNQYLCRYAGVPEETPLRSMFETWLAEV